MGAATPISDSMEAAAPVSDSMEAAAPTSDSMAAAATTLDSMAVAATTSDSVVATTTHSESMAAESSRRLPTTASQATVGSSQNQSIPLSRPKHQRRPNPKYSTIPMSSAWSNMELTGCVNGVKQRNRASRGPWFRCGAWAPDGLFEVPCLTGLVPSPLFSSSASTNLAVRSINKAYLVKVSELH
nr:hypothetical protein Iba_chr06aCG16650 [Ipomoea batatas]